MQSAASGLGDKGQGRTRIQFGVDQYQNYILMQFCIQYNAIFAEIVFANHVSQLRKLNFDRVFCTRVNPSDIIIFKHI